MSDWTKLLGDYLDSQERVPENSKTFKELREEWGFGERKCRRILSYLIDNNRIRVIKGTQKDASGRLNLQVWYQQI